MRLRPQSIYQWTRGKSLWNHFNSFSFVWSNKKHQLLEASPFSFYRCLFLSCSAAIKYNNYFNLTSFFRSVLIVKHSQVLDFCLDFVPGLEKPVQKFTVRCLYERHLNKVWFSCLLPEREPNFLQQNVPFDWNFLIVVVNVWRKWKKFYGNGGCLKVKKITGSSEKSLSNCV